MDGITNPTSRFEPKTEAEQRGFFEAVLAASAEAERRAQPERFALEIAGCRIDLVFAGPRLVQEFLPALQHNLVENARAPKAVIHIFDTESTGARMPRPPCSSEHFTDRGDIWGFNSRRYRAAFHFSEFAVNVMDLEAGEAVYWVQHTRNLPYWSKASPLRTLLHWILERDGAQLLHAAAIGDERGAVLLTGKGGVGKSTTALTGLVHGLQYVSDDYLAVRLGPELRAYSLYCTAKLNAEDIATFPQLAAHVSNVPSSEGEKAVIQLDPAFKPQVAKSMPLRAVLTPRAVASRTTDFEPVDPLAVRRAAAFTTLSQLPYAGPATQAFVDAMVDRLPCLTIRLGQDRAGVSGAVLDLLEKTDGDIWQLAAGAWEQPKRAMTAAPLISVIVPVYNAAGFLPEAISTILEQRYPSLEIIVVDDGSVDEIASAVAKLPVDVRFIRQNNTGPAGARNRGIREASGSVIAFLDVDDLWPDGNLCGMIGRLSEDPELMVTLGRAQVMTRDPETGRYAPTGNPDLAFPFYIGAALYRREVFERVGVFDAEMRYGEDTDWFQRLSESGVKHERIDQVTLHVRRHGGNMTLAVTPEELRKTTIRAAKKAIDRKRQARSSRSDAVQG